MPHPTGRPWIFAHRGASRAARENTIEAFRLAAEMGADGVELDARRTADGAVVVHHDAVLPGADLPIIEMTRAQVAAHQPTVPDLTGAIAACGEMWVDIEIKNSPLDPDHDPDDAVLRAVEPLVTDRVIVTSFNAQTVARAHRAGMRCGWLLLRSLDPVEALGDWPGYDFVLPSVEAMASPAAIVEAAADVGAEVGAWTVDDPSLMSSLADAGIGILFTNEPDLAVATIG